MQRFELSPARLGAAGLLLMLLSVPAFAQQVPPVGEPAVLATGLTMLVALISGVVLAIAIQVLLTNLAVALGLNMIGPFAHGEADKDEHKEKHKSPDKEADHGKGKNLFQAWRKVNGALGMYAIVTASVALFIAAWLGVGLSFVGTGTPIDPAIGVVLGLVIWGVTLLVMARFEFSAMTSLAGGLFHIAGTGMRNVVGMAKGMFGVSAAEKAIETGAERVEEMSREISKEILGGKPGKTIDHKLREYMRMIRPERKSHERMRHELEEMFDDTELHIVARDNQPIAQSEEIVAHLVHTGHAPHRAKRLVNQALNALHVISSERNKEGKPTAAKAIDAVQRVGGRDEESAQRDRERIENFLRNTHRDELNPDAIERELLDLFRHPTQGGDELSNRIRSFDRQTFVAMIEQRKDLSHEDAQRIVNKAVEVIEKVRSGARSVVGTVSGTAREAGELASASAGAAGHAIKEQRDTLVTKLRNYLDRTGREELDYDEIMHDLKLMFSHPTEGVSHWRERLSKLDRDTVKGLISARKDLDEHDAEMILNQIETARDAAVMKLREVEEAVTHRMRQAREYALEQADEARKTAANMAWWALGTGVVSGAAAAIGGFLGAGFFI